ncbi:MAG: HDIG domain-containing protein [Porphyromonadaceae bacterium]|nr:HDIG domain-containing protein [Porphyromonadaceae bacterium]
MWKQISIPKTIAKNLRIISSFALLALIITLIAPQEKGFQYQFSKGKPWQYDLLTAPYDFPIYKAEQRIKAEQDSIRQNIKPVYTLDKDLEGFMLSELKDDYERKMHQTVPRPYYIYVVEQMRKLYRRGLIDANQLAELRKQGKLEISLLGQDNVMERVPITRFYTLGEAYDLLFDHLPQELDRSTLSTMGLSHYLRDNILYNEELTNQILERDLSTLSSSVGMIQRGERIIDKGEIVTPYTYSLLRSLALEQAQRTGTSLQTIGTSIGIFLSLGLLFFVLALYLIFFFPSFTSERKNILFLLISLGLFIGFTALNAQYELVHIYVVPFVMATILIRTFFDSNIALISHIVCVFGSAIFTPDPLSFILMQSVAGFVALIAMQNLSSRAQLIRTAFLVYVTYIVMSTSTAIMTQGEVSDNHWLPSLYFAINLVFLMFAYVLAFLVEKTFGYVSNVSLVELSDINTPLLRELSEVAPGTFQHSLQVSILATEAASKVGGDVQLIRTGALYHDIGKIKNPSYFTENQGENNPHRLLPCKESAQIIIRHVSDGIALAQKHNLPEQIIDFIRTHHGMGMTRYFYNTYCNEHPHEEVDPTPYTYPGPNPRTKEQGILMLSDAVEASSRSLKEYTEEGIRGLLERIVDGIVSEGLLNDTPLTFRDIKTIKDVFFVKLKTMYHARISYPEKQV